jgi:hypothetical protein
MMLYLAVSGDGLRCAGRGILVPMMSSVEGDEDTAILFKPSDKFLAFHAIRSSATRRTPGIFPPVRSSKMSFRFS